MKQRSNFSTQGLLIVGLLVSAVAAACSTYTPLRFPHAKHLAGVECGVEGKPKCLSCNNCHTVSKDDRAHRLPDEVMCSSCHKNDGNTIEAVLANVPERTAGKIIFNHDEHLAMNQIQGQCVTCHSGVVKASGANLPAMSDCFSCHEHQEQWNAGTCGPCHARADLARSMPQTFLRHDQSFMRHHGTLAKEEKQLCQSCHEQSQCAACHDLAQDLSIERRQPERVERNFVHRGDFMVRHAIEAQEQPAKCVRCHTVDTCDSCHVARGVSANRANSRNPHPVGWVTSDSNSRSLHGRESKRDVLLCASCHDQGPATNCIRCHKVGGFGGNPHPNGWKSTQSKASGMCRYCHG